MNVLRNRFLNTAATLSDPRDPVNDGTQQSVDDDNGDAGAGEDDNGDTGEDDNVEANEDNGADDAGDEDGDAAADDEDDPDLAEFTPEQRKKVKDKIAKETRWRDRQLERTHARRRSAEEDARAAAAVAAGTVKPGETLTEAQIEERAKVLAGQMSSQERYDNDCNDTHAKGVKDFGKRWGTALAKLPKLGGIDVTDMVDILATEAPHVVMVELSDPDVYDRVMALPPARRRTEFVKLSLKELPKRVKQGENKRPGDAPPPPRVLNGNGRRVAATQVNLADDSVSDEAWYAERNRTRRRKFSDHA